MKKFTLVTMMLLLTLNGFAIPTTANTPDPITTSNNPKEMPAEVRVMLNRLDEIKAIDKSALNRSERKELRKEVRSIKSTLRASGNGVYLSVGAIVIIALLLIILL